MPRLSIIIPVLSSAQRLESTLVSVLANRPRDCEIVVTLNQPYDDPYDLKDEVRFVHVPESSGLVDSLNAGIEASRSSIVHLLSAGFEVSEGWTDGIWKHFRDPRVASVAPLLIDALDSHQVLAAGLEYAHQTRVVRTPSKLDSLDEPTEILGPLAQAGFYRRSALELVGGLPSAVGDSLADVDLALTLSYAGYCCVLEPTCQVQASATDFLPDGRSSFLNGLAAERLFWRTVPVVGWGKSILVHPWSVLGEFVMNLPRPKSVLRLLGRALGCCQIGNYRAHHQWLQDVQRAGAALLRAGRPMHIRIDSTHPAVSSSHDNVETAVRTHG
ncbi:MAG: glycosyltransferase [Planctomycetota bacterium]|nr:glycosyltransferase [Planctomycetota bacterium]